MKLHNQLLQAGGSRWDDWAPFRKPAPEPSSWKTAECQIAELLEADFGGSRLFAVKDPRICRFVPIWLELLEAFRAQSCAVLIIRHPFEVARSLQTRNDMPFNKGCLLWLRHVIEAEHATRNIPRAFVSYEGLLQAWTTEVARIFAQLPIDWPRTAGEIAPNVSEFLTEGLRHHVSTTHDFDVRSDVADWIRRAFQALEGLVGTGENEVSRRELDQIRAEFDNACLSFGDLIRREREDAAQIDSLRGELASSQGSVERLQEALTGAQKGIGSLTEQLEVMQSRTLREKTRRLVKKLRPIAKPIERTLQFGRDLGIGLVTLRFLGISRHDLRLAFYKRQMIATGLFDAQWYLDRYRDVADNGVDPLEDWLENGVAERRNPNAYFDVAWYLYHCPHLEQTGQNPLIHYMRRGAKHGLDPGPEFRTLAYAQQHAELSNGRQNPLAHFLQRRRELEQYQASIQGSETADVTPKSAVGRGLVRKIGRLFGYPQRKGNRAGNPLASTSEYEVLQNSGCFDSKYYLAQNPDVASAKLDPLEHFIEHGWRAGRNPSADFDCKFYLARNVDVEDGQVNPLLHYILWGMDEGREAAPRCPTSAYQAWLEVNSESGNRRKSLESALRREMASRDIPQATAGKKAVEAPLRYSDHGNAFAVTIAAAKYVTFDLFDTLVERRVLAPVDIFQLVETVARSEGWVDFSFAEQREAAEADARRTSSFEEVSLDEIYIELCRRTGVSEAIANRLKAQEIASELQYLHRRPAGMELFDIALALGKPVAIVSDIYLTKEVVEQVLAKCGICGYAKLFLSSEQRQTKHHGTLFHHVLAEISCHPGQLVHVGDSQHSDDQVPRSLGIQTWAIRNKRDLFQENSGRDGWAFDQSGNRQTRIIRSTCGALVAERKFALLNPEGQFLSPPEGDPYQLGYTTLGPLLVGMAGFVAATARNRQYSDLLFVSRDGYFMKAAYDLLASIDQELPPSTYFLSSRKMCYAISLDGHEAVKAIVDKDYFPTTIRHFLTHRFEFSHDQIEHIDEGLLKRFGFRSVDDRVAKHQNHKSLCGLVGHFAKDICGKAAEDREVFREYIGQLHLENNRPAVVDVGYGGSAQRSLARFVDREIGGIYLITSRHATGLDDDALPYDSFLGKNVSFEHEFFAHVQMAELLLSATHPSVVGIQRDADGVLQPRFDTQFLPPRNAVFLAAIHKGALEFAQHYLQQNSSLLAHIDFGDIDPSLFYEPTRQLLRKPASSEVALFQGMVFEDRFGADARPLILSPDEVRQVGTGELKQHCCWPEGSLALCTSERNAEVIDIDGLATAIDELGYAERDTPGDQGVPLTDDFTTGGEVVPSYTQSPYSAFFDEGDLLRFRCVASGACSGEAAVSPEIKFQVLVEGGASSPSELGRTVQSLFGQTYDNWELVLLLPDDMPQEQIRGLGRCLDARVKIRSGVSLEAAISASGARQWAIAVKSGDMLESNALLECTLWAVEHPACKVIFSDHDLIDANGERNTPSFNPGWSPELLLSGMYPEGLLAIRGDFLEQVGGLDESSGEFATLDLMLRATERDAEVGHVSRILLHRSQTKSSQPLDSAQAETGIAVLQQSLDNRGIAGSVAYSSWAETEGKAAFSIRFPDNGPSVAVLIPTKNGLPVLKQCLQSLWATAYQNYKVYVVDNESDDPATLEFLKECGHEVLRIESPNGQFNYAFINNEAVRRVHEEYILFLNNDTEVISPEWLSQMVGWLQVDGVGSVGARLLYGNKTIQHAGLANGLLNRVLPAPTFKLARDDDPGYMDLIWRSRNCSAVTAACMLTPRQLFLEQGGFDEVDFAVAYNDCDYGFRLVQQGYRNVYCPEALLYHHEGTTRGTGNGNDSPYEEAACVRKYGRWKDPYFNSNFRRDRLDFTFGARTVVTGEVPKIRLAMLTHNLNYEGAPLILWEIAKGLKDRGIAEPVLVSPLDGPLRETCHDAGVQVHVLPRFDILNANDACTYNQRLRCLADELHGLGAEAVVCNTILSWWGIDAARTHDLPSLWVIHESEEPFSQFDMRGKYVKNRARNMLAAAYQVVFVADATRRRFEPFNTRNNFAVIHNGFDASRLDEQVDKGSRDRTRRALGIDADELCVLLPGTVCERKRQIDILDAIRLLDEQSMRRAHFCIVGDRPSPYSTRLHEILRRLPQERSDRVHVISETGEIGPYYQAADIFVLTSGMESFPKVIQEAMHSSLPIITTPVFGIREQVQDETTALFFEPGDVEKLCEHLQRLIASPEERARLGRNARVSLDILPNYEEMVEEYATLVQEAWLSGRSRRMAA